MSQSFVAPSPDVVAALREEANRPLSTAELRELDAIPLGDDERRENLELIEWFLRRYPTPEARLAYARRAYRRWQRAFPAE